jgi:hypothetical protein
LKAKADRGIWVVVPNPAVAIAHHAIVVHCDLCLKHSVGNFLGRSSSCGGLRDIGEHPVVQSCGVWGSLLKVQILFVQTQR